MTEPQQGILQQGTLSSQHTGTEGLRNGKAFKQAAVDHLVRVHCMYYLNQ
jgi:hypothetical protein